MPRPARGLAALLLSLALAGAAPAHPEVYARTLPATAFVQSWTNPTSFSYGTGVLVDRDRRLLLTASHVVDDRPEVSIYFPAADKDGLVCDPQAYLRDARQAIPGRVIARDPK